MKMTSLIFLLTCSHPKTDLFKAFWLFIILLLSSCIIISYWVLILIQILCRLVSLYKYIYFTDLTGCSGKIIFSNNFATSHSPALSCHWSFRKLKELRHLQCVEIVQDLLLRYVNARVGLAQVFDSKNIKTKLKTLYT